MSIDILRVRKKLGRDNWHPPQQYGPDGYSMVSRNLAWQVIITTTTRDGVDYIHATLAGFDDTPSHEQLEDLHSAVFGDHRYAYQVFTTAEHVNPNPHALQLIGRADGQPVLPEFTATPTGRTT